MTASDPTFLVVAIDGGAASGKSSTARGLCRRFGFLHVDTGSFYRALAAKLLQAGVPPESGPALDGALASLRLDTALEDGAAQIRLDGWIPDASIRSEAVNETVSRYAALPEIRRFLLDYQRRQRDFARDQGFKGLVMEGRDIGSVVFPEAPVRLFLSADPQKRAARRAAEGIQDDVVARDKIDGARAAAPLKKPEGSIEIDTSELSLEEVIDKAASIVERALEACRAK